jgi:hypothetical protein
VSRRMYRYVVPIDDSAHDVSLTGDPVAVAATPDDVHVEFWAENRSEALGIRRSFRVFGTGHDIPAGARYAGTCPRTALGLVWHLYEVAA